MQTKTISKTIQAKINAWVESINDTQLRHDVKNNILVSGGSIASMFLNEEVNDYDVYFTDRKVLLAICNYYTKGHEGNIKVLDGHHREDYIEEYRGGVTMKEFLERPGHKASVLRNLKDEQVKLYMHQKGGGHRVEEKRKDADGKELPFQPSYFSPNAISLTDDLQIVIRFCGTPDEVHKTFDYIHATNYWIPSKGVITNLEAVESLLTKQLKYQGSFYPLTSIIRMKKFVKRGFNIGAGEMLKMIFQVSLLDLTDMDVLEDQLIGVDVAYFEVLINALRERKENDSSFVLTTDYLCELIDRIFNQHIDGEQE